MSLSGRYTAVLVPGLKSYPYTSDSQVYKVVIVDGTGARVYEDESSDFHMNLVWLWDENDRLLVHDKHTWEIWSFRLNDGRWSRFSEGKATSLDSHAVIVTERTARVWHDPW